MDRKTWTVDIDGTQHKVALDWTYWGGDRQVSVDGDVVNKDTKLLRWKSAQEFEVAGHPALIKTEPARKISSQFVISMELDGVEIEPDPGQPAFWEKNEGSDEEPATA